MLARIALAFFALFPGGWMVADGVRVLRTGRYYGPPTPGPWRHVVAAVGVDPFAMGVPFVVLGAAWLAATAALLVTGSVVAWWALVVVAGLTLWFLPVGTLVAVLTLVTLVAARSGLVG